MGVITIFLVNPPIGAFNTWLNNCLASMGESSKILLGAVLGGMMSIDSEVHLTKQLMYLVQRQSPADR